MSNILIAGMSRAIDEVTTLSQTAFTMYFGGSLLVSFPTSRLVLELYLSTIISWATSQI